MDKSIALIFFVNIPIETKSTPVSAIFMSSDSFSIPPEASNKRRRETKAKPLRGPLSREFGTLRTVEARFLPWLSGQGLQKPFELFSLRSEGVCNKLVEAAPLPQLLLPVFRLVPF